MTSFEPPSSLVDSILGGRCLAFIGAGFSVPVMPSWGELLEGLAGRLDVEGRAPEPGNALHFEAFGQWLRDQAGARWEPLVKQVLDERLVAATPAARAAMRVRLDLLRRIPFKAILTTNFDPTLEATATTLAPEVYAEVLRDERARWWNAPSATTHELPRTPLLKLHGDANGDPLRLPLVLGRDDYRQRVYADRNYANFIRAAFAEYSVLFIGVSFTDAYLNELRSEVLHLVHRRDGAPPWGYAVVRNPSPMFCEFMRKHEGIEVLPIAEFHEVERRLGAIADRTSIEGRLATLLANKRVVWIDPNPQNNELGRALLTQTGAVASLTSLDQLTSAHHDADLLLTHFGYDGPGRSHAFELLDRLRGWPQRPPVIVFASGDATPEQLGANRRECLRRGAWEYATEWGELYRAIELVLGRVPGQSASY